MAVVADVFSWLVAHPGIPLTGLLLSAFIAAVARMFRSPKAGPNPFRHDVRRPPGKLEMDDVVRDKVLKQAFTTKNLPQNPDVIVIGSGIGGLSVAAILARVGKKVLVLEQHDQAGGCCHTYKEKGFEFDVGIHYIGEMRNNTMMRLLVEQVTEGQLQWCDLIDEFDVVALGEAGKEKFIPFCCGGKEAWKKNLLKYFPKEEKALDRFLELIQEARKGMLGQVGMKFMSKTWARILINTGLLNRFTKFFEYSNRSLQEVVDELTEDKDLKAVLSYSFGDYGSLPKDAPFTMHATLINHYLYGASYPRGGASEIAYHMIPLIQKAGGRVLVRASVSEILIDDSGKAHGVRVQKSSGPVDLYAPLIISDAGAINTFKRLLPKDVAQRSPIYRMIQDKKVESGMGAMSLFVGLNGTAEELGLKAQNIWAFNSNELNQIVQDYLDLDQEDVAEAAVPMVFISFPSTKDDTFNERFPGKTVCTVVTLARWSWFQSWENNRVNKRGADYDVIKTGVGRRMWERVISIFPQLEDKVEYFEVGTPATNKYYLGAPAGEIYGLDHGKRRFGSPNTVMTLRPDTEIPNLLLTGQDVMSAGFAGALFGGVISASRALNRNLWTDLVDLKKNIDKSK